MGTPGPLELILIFAVVLLIFGAKRIPEIARGIGKGIREFKDATSEISRELQAEGEKRQINQPQQPQQGAPQARQPQQEPQPEPSGPIAGMGEGDAARGCFILAFLGHVPCLRCLALRISHEAGARRAMTSRVDVGLRHIADQDPARVGNPAACSRWAGHSATGEGPVAACANPIAISARSTALGAPAGVRAPVSTAIGAASRIRGAAAVAEPPQSPSRP